MRAEIISIGTEILLGEIVDTNSAYVAARLPALGIDLYFKHAVGDNLGRLVDVIGRARGRNDLVLCRGGLGAAGRGSPTTSSSARAASGSRGRPRPGFPGSWPGSTCRSYSRSSRRGCGA